MRLQDIMNTDVVTAQVNDSAESAWNTMVFQDIRHLIVMDGLEVVGVLSDRDLGGKNGDAIRRNKQVADLMSPNPITATPRMTLKEAANAFRGASIGCIPVLDAGRLAGVITITDLLEIVGIGVERRTPGKEYKQDLDRTIYLRTGHSPKK